MATTTIWLKDEANGHPVSVILPNVWQGECECVVGPFSSRDVARRFAGFGEDFGHFELCERVFAHRDAWYIEVSALA